MDLEVDPWALADVAARVSRLTPALHAALPAGWMAPAGEDAGSAAAAGYFNGQAQAAYNALARVLDEVSDHAHRVGAAAADYTRADVEGGQLLGSGGGQALNNPVPVPFTHAGRLAPTPPAVSPSAVDSLTFAKQLYSGHGPGAARDYAGSIREFLRGAHASTLEGLDVAAPALAAWTPVGAAAAARLTAHRDALDAIGTGLGALADGVEAYADAFQTAKDRHPAPDKIEATRQRLLDAMRTKNAAAISAALAEFEEQNGISAQTAADYVARLGAAAATTDAKTAASGASTTTGGGTTTGTNGNSSDSSMLTNMLPMLLSGLTSSNGLLSQHNPTGNDSTGLGGDDLTGDGYEPLPTIPSFDGGGGVPSVPSLSPDSPLGGEPTSFPVGQLPTAGAPSQLTGLPRTPVIDQLPNSAAGAGNPRAGTSPYPYMPMAPGMGGAGAGAGGGDRNRVVAWHPDRLMYVDDTPHTEAVIGEKPSIAPTITPATPAQTPTPTGGTA